MYDQSTSDDPHRILPSSLEELVVGWMSRGVGVALITTACALWLAMVSWSAADPSLTHSDGASLRNLLGQPGALVSDLFLQLFGMIAAPLLIGPIAWGLQLLGRERIANFKVRFVQFAAGMLLICGGASALPTSAAWPLAYGYGGLSGDIVYMLLGGVASTAVAGLGGTVAGLFGTVAGCWLVAVGLGLNARDLTAAWHIRAAQAGTEIPIVRPRASVGGASPHPRTGWRARRSGT